MPLGEYALFGSAPLAVRHLRENTNLDVIVSRKLWHELIQKDYFSYDMNNDSLAYKHVELFSRLDYFDVKAEKLIFAADVIGSIPYVSLSFLIQSKEHLGREQDKRDIQLIKDYLQAE